MSRQAVRTFFPQTRLSELAARPGGIARSDAIEGARKSVESLRGQGDATILASIREIERVAFSAKGGQLSQDDLAAVLRLGDQVITLAGTFGYDALDRVARSLCDLADGLSRAGIQDAAPIMVHVQSMFLVSPGKLALSQDHIDKIHEELAKVIAHYKIGSLAMPGVAEDGEIVLNPR